MINKTDFSAWLSSGNKENSGKARSYLTALDDINQILHSLVKEFDSPSVFELPRHSLETLREFFIRESKNSASAILRVQGLHGSSYLKNRFYSASISKLLDYLLEKQGTESTRFSEFSDRLTIALKKFASCRGTEKTEGWDNYDAWTKTVRTEFPQVNESLVDNPVFDYTAYMRKYATSWQVANTMFSTHSDAEKRAVLKFLQEQKNSPKSASWYIDGANRLMVAGNPVKGMSSKTLLYFMSELRPTEFAAWTEPTYEGLSFLGLHKGPIPKDLTVETYEDCRAKQHQIVARMKEEKKILIKEYPNVGKFGNCLRVSIGEKKYMQQFMDALIDIDR